MKTISFDIDGTLSLKGRPNKTLINLLRTLHRLRFKILIVTARPIAEQERTVRWLKENGVPYGELRMRPRGDNSPDEVLRRKQVAGSVLHFDDKPANCAEVRIPCVRV